MAPTWGRDRREGSVSRVGRLSATLGAARANWFFVLPMRREGRQGKHCTATGNQWCTSPEQDNGQEQFGSSAPPFSGSLACPRDDKQTKNVNVSELQSGKEIASEAVSADRQQQTVLAELITSKSNLANNTKQWMHSQAESSSPSRKPHQEEPQEKNWRSSLTIWVRSKSALMIAIRM